MRPKKILVTGGAGFIGSHLVDKLLKEGYKVWVIDDLSGGRKENVNPKARFYKCDLKDERQADEAITKIKPEIVYHLAASAAEMKAQFSPIEITSRNYNTFINTLVPALRNGTRRIVFTSSIAVYGDNKTPFKETAEPKPEDLYGISKLAIEQTLKVLGRVHNFEYVITRPHNVYGPRQNMADPYRNVVMIFMNALLKEEPYYIYGDGEQRRCFSYIDEVVEAIFRCGFYDVSGMTFNIGSSKDCSINELSDTIQEALGTNISPKYTDGRPQEVKVAIPSHALAKKHLGYKNKTSLRNGIKSTWEYAKKMGYQKPKFTDIELDSPRLPRNWRV